MVAATTALRISCSGFGRHIVDFWENFGGDSNGSCSGKKFHMGVRSAEAGLNA